MNLLLSRPVHDSLSKRYKMMIVLSPVPSLPPLFHHATIISLCARHPRLISVVRTKMIITLSVILNCGIPLLRVNVARVKDFLWSVRHSARHFIHASVNDPRYILYICFRPPRLNKFCRVGPPRRKIRKWYFRQRDCGALKATRFQRGEGVRAFYHPLWAREPPSRLLSA